MTSLDLSRTNNQAPRKAEYLCGGEIAPTDIQAIKEQVKPYLDPANSVYANHTQYFDGIPANVTEYLLGFLPTPVLMGCELDAPSVLEILTLAKHLPQVKPIGYTRGLVFMLNGFEYYYEDSSLEWEGLRERLGLSESIDEPYYMPFVGDHFVVMWDSSGLSESSRAVEFNESLGRLV